jgi:SAM-dependent methyltransferase
MNDDGTHRFYGELAVWWPLISPPEEYEEEAAFSARLLQGAARPVREVLELGSGGGHNAVHLKRHFDLTLVDISEPMLDVSRALNPECTHVAGDMRTIRIGRQFDAVFLHDAVDYMTTEADLARALRTAYEHCRPGGIVVCVPDHTTETFEPDDDVGGSDAPDGRGVRFLEWTFDPDPRDTTIVTAYAFLLRDTDGSIRNVAETHTTGLFPREVWLRLLGDTGFEAEVVREVTTEDRTPRDFFCGRRAIT